MTGKHWPVSAKDSQHNKVRGMSIKTNTQIWGQMSLQILLLGRNCWEKGLKKEYNKDKMQEAGRNKRELGEEKDKEEKQEGEDGSSWSRKDFQHLIHEGFLGCDETSEEIHKEEDGQKHLSRTRITSLLNHIPVVCFKLGEFGKTLVYFKPLV